MGADRNKEPPEKTPKKQSAALAARPKKYALEMWVEIETSAGVYSTQIKTLTALILPSTLSTMHTLGVLAFTWVWLAICWPFTERRPTLEQASFMVKPSQPVKPS